jgi:hypothetical protein
VSGTPNEVLALIDSWMQRQELLRVRRRIGERLTWEARRDFMGSMQASFNLGGRPYALTPASEVGATVVAVDASRVLVRLDADFAPSRRRNVVWAGVTSGMGITFRCGCRGAGVPLSGARRARDWRDCGSVWTAMAGLGAAGIARAQRRKVARGQLALEQVLDRLEHGEIRTAKSTLMDFLSSVR